MTNSPKPPRESLEELLATIPELLIGRYKGAPILVAKAGAVIDEGGSS